MNETNSKISFREILYVSVGFVLSIVHWAVCAVYFAALLFYLRQGYKGCVKALLILTTRGILSTAVAKSFNDIIQTEKWALIFAFTLFILFSRQPEKRTAVVSDARTFIFAFMLYCIAVAPFTSSYPVVSAFKAVSYALPFYAVILAVSMTSREVDWINYLFWLLTAVMAASAFTIPFDKYKIVNDSFQGIINHPNLFGVLGAIYIVTALYNIMKHPERANVFVLGMTALTFVMIYLSESRTGMFSALIMVAVYYISLPKGMKIKGFVLVLGLLVIVTAVFTIRPGIASDFRSSVDNFVNKRGADDIFDSRDELVESSMNKYHNNELFGSGFGVPYVNGLHDYQFSFSITHETGNLPTALLGDCGLAGSTIFYLFILYMFIKTRRKKWILFFLPLVVSFGEQAFFATNNIAIYYYLFFGICLSSDNSEAALNAA